MGDGVKDSNPGFEMRNEQDQQQASGEWNIGDGVGKEPFVSYAQNGEDTVLWRALQQVKSGTFIDIGAGHPVMNSISKAFVNAGWHGINVEPMEKPFADLVTDRPHDINLNIAVEDHEGTATYFSVGGGSGASTGISEIARGHEARHMEVREQSVTTRTLTNICEDYIDGEIHFLKIDVEGNERKVLEGADFERFRPWVVVVEAIHPYATAPSTGLPLETQEEWQHILIDARYTCTLFDGVNRFYVAEEHRAVIGPRLSMPANPKDRALSAKTNQIMAELADVTKELNAQIQQLRQELDRSAREVVALRQTFSWRITKPLRVLRSGCRRQPK